MSNYSKEQQAAIYTMDKNILVSASAGSGKTTVLIARLLHIVKDKRIDISKILAMTFTEAAANEMKKRLGIELLRQLQNASNEEDSAYLQTQLAKMENASISTIHGFCLQVIKDYYYMIDIQQERTTNILDDMTTKKLLNESVESALKAHSDDPRFVSFLSTFSRRNQLSDTYDYIKQLVLLANTKSDPIHFLRSCMQVEKQSFKDFDVLQVSYFFDYLNLFLQRLDDALISFQDLQQTDIITEKLHVLADMQKAITQSDYENFRNQLFKQCKLLTKAIKDVEESKELKKEIESIEASLLALAFEEKTYVDASNNNLDCVNLFCEICISTLQFYTQSKINVKGIDFNDMEHLALRILKAHDGFVANKYKQHFFEIMVDEFQDSNAIQDELVSLICKENNVFRVGDIKQSIYGFRHATPDIMRSLIQNKSEFDEIIYLSSNYRSKKSIVDFNNALFNKLMNIRGFSSSFIKQDATTTGLDSQAHNNRAIEMHLLDDKSINEEQLPQSKDTLKSTYIANCIVDKVKSGEYDFKDFVVLIRSNAKALDLRDAFQQASIPYFIEMKNGFFESDAISQVLTFLKAIQNPYDNISFCALMLSSFFQFTDDTLAKAKLEKEDKETYYEYFKRTIDLQPFENFRKEASHISLSTLIQNIYHFNEFYFTYASQQHRTNLDKLLEMIVQKENKEYVSIHSFLHMIESSDEIQIGEGIPISLQENVVRVMSIHQSKGLQFPFVFLYSTTSLLSAKNKGLIAFDDTLKIGLKSIRPNKNIQYPSLERIALDHKQLLSNIEEEMRILYVATTRAQNEMYIVDCAQTNEYSSMNRAKIFKLKGYSTWIGQVYSEIISTLFQIKQIQKPFPIKQFETPSQTHVNIEKYTHQASTISQASATQNKLDKLEAFHLDSDLFMQRGTHIHAIIERLPLSAYTKQNIKEHASLWNYSISDNDIQHILKLGNNDIFKQCHTQQTYHEYPFMVRDGESLLHGYIDFISIGDVIYIIDFKSDRNIDRDAFIQNYQDQLQTYRKAMSLLYKDKPIYTYIYSLQLDCMIEVL